MTIVQEIRNWFTNGCLYFPGVMLYARINGDVPISYFNGYHGANFIPSPVKDRLKHQLRTYLIANPAPHTVQEITSVKETPNIPQKKQATPSAINTLKNRAKKLHKQHELLKNSLRTTESVEDRYQVCVLIMEEIIPQLDEIYDRIRQWEDTGKLPAVSDNEVVKQTVQKMFRRLSLIPRISRLNKLVTDTTLDKKTIQKYKKELINKELELNNLNKELEIE